MVFRGVSRKGATCELGALDAHAGSAVNLMGKSGLPAGALGIWPWLARRELDMTNVSAIANVGAVEFMTGRARENVAGTLVKLGRGIRLRAWPVLHGVGHTVSQ